MLYTAVLKKEAVSLQGGIYNIVVRCEIFEGEEIHEDDEPIWEGTGSGRYNPSTGNLNAPKNAILSELQAKWGKWKAEQNIHNSAGFDSAITDMQNAVNAYINS